MKCKGSQLFLILCFFAMLLFPSYVLEGAKSGLLLWFFTVLPTLFPFLVMSRLLLSSCACALLSRISAPVLCRIFHISPQGAFAVIVGFLCGYPMGAKISADLLKSGQITSHEAAYLLSFCNNISPVFLISYVVLGCLKKAELLLPSILILYGTPLVLSIFFRPAGKMLSSDSHISQDSSVVDLDDCLMDSCESIVKIGSYIILFSILLNLLIHLPIQFCVFRLLLLPSLELTNGISLLCNSSAPSFPLQYMLCMGHTAFGGWCSVLQTKSMISESDLSIRPYVIKKLVTATATSLLAYLYICCYQ